MIFSKLSDPNLDSNDVVFKELIIFASKLLEGGNVEVQKSVYSYFTRFDNSEMFFYKVYFFKFYLYCLAPRYIASRNSEGEETPRKSKL